MPFEGFVHPALAAGALLAVVPLIIHLLNRQRHQPLQWAAMRFVVAAYKRTRRRAQLENLLLLLLRMAAVALLAFTVARPFTGKDSPLAPLTESRRDLVLILDASASTGYREGVEGTFERIQTRAREILGELDGARGDRVRLFVAAARARELSTRAPEDALALLGTLTSPTHESLDLVSVLSEVARHAEEEAAGTGASMLEVRLLSDLQRVSFVPRVEELSGPAPASAETQDAASPAPAQAASSPMTPLERVLDRLAELDVRIVVEDLGPPTLQPPNLAVTAITPLNETLAAGLVGEVLVTVANHGASGRTGVRVALEIDGERLPSHNVDLDARSTADVPFTVRFREGGFHTLEARLEGDRLALDDVRATVLFVPPPVRVLLVNGDPAEEIDRDEIGYLQAVLEPTDDGSVGTRFAPFQVRTLTAAAFGASERDFDESDVIVLANVEALAPQVVKRLESHVAAGGALVIALGDRVAHPSALEGMNARLWRADGTGLLPARLLRPVEVADRRAAWYRVVRFEEDHPILSFFADESWRPLLTEMPIYGFVATEPVEGAAVLAWLDDERESPLLMERGYDRGRVLLWTSSIDAGWNRLPEVPAALVPFAHELLRYAARATVARRTVRVGGTVAPEVSRFPRQPYVVHPDGSRTQLDGEPETVADGVWRLPPIIDVDRVGLWRIELEGEADVAFSVELDPRESDLDRIPPDELEAIHPVFLVDSGEDDGGADTQAPERGELWRWFAAATLLFLILETLWAAWIGGRRRLS